MRSRSPDRCVPGGLRGSADRSEPGQPKRQSESRVRPSPRTYLAPDPPVTERPDARLTHHPCQITDHREPQHRRASVSIALRCSQPRDQRAPAQRKSRRCSASETRPSLRQRTPKYCRSSLNAARNLAVTRLKPGGIGGSSQAAPPGGLRLCYRNNDYWASWRFEFAFPLFLSLSLPSPVSSLDESPSSSDPNASAPAASPS